MRVVAYIRVSSEREEQENSLANQRSMIIQYARRNDWIVVEEYTDVESGTTDERENFLRLMDDIKLNKFDVVICKELSRLSRNGEITYKLSRLAEIHSVRLLTLDGSVDSADPNKEDTSVSLDGCTNKNHVGYQDVSKQYSRQKLETVSTSVAFHPMGIVLKIRL